METNFDRGIVVTELKTPGVFGDGDFPRVCESLQKNGLAVVRNFLPQPQVEKIREAAKLSCERGYGMGAGLTIDPVKEGAILEFRHPYLTSPTAVEYITSENVLRVIESQLGEKPLIHNSVYQISLPANKLSVDFHIDCGSIKALNGKNKFSDLRIRTILYLTDVESGGFSYILNSQAAALKTFLAQPVGELFPPNQVPSDPERRYTVHEPAGTIIFFNTHGLHRPEIPSKARMVLNTWFARRDFSGRLPPILFSAAAIPAQQKHRSYIFENERNCPLADYAAAVTTESTGGLGSAVRAFAKALRQQKTSAPSAYE